MGDDIAGKGRYCDIKADTQRHATKLIMSQKRLAWRCCWRLRRWFRLSRRSACREQRTIRALARKRRMMNQTRSAEEAIRSLLGALRNAVKVPMIVGTPGDVMGAVLFNVSRQTTWNVNSIYHM